MRHYIDKIEVRNEAVFGNKESHVLEMDFMDGVAISNDKKCGMTYPTLEQVKKTQWMQDEILAYCGDNRKGDCTFDIALKFGKLFELPVNVKLSKQVKYLENFVQPEDLQEYERFCKSLEQPNRSYFVLYHDRTGDGGMTIACLGKFNCLDEAKKVAIEKFLIPIGRTREAEISKNGIYYDVVLQDETRIDAVYVDNDIVSTEYWAILSRDYNEKKQYGTLVWNRDDQSNDVQNCFMYSITLPR